MYKLPHDYPFVQELEANWQLIRAELDRVPEKYFVPWPERDIYGQGWNVFGIYAFGIKINKNAELCPETAKQLAKIPHLVTAGFSALLPNAHITPHTGYDDGLLRCHLGLRGCSNCFLRVGDRTESWQEGKCLVFDDTTEHEAWNKGTEVRVILLLDFRDPERLKLNSQLTDKKDKKGWFSWWK